MPTEIKRLHVSSECLKAIHELQARFPDLMALKGPELEQVYYRAMMSFVTENNPIEYKRTIDDLKGNPIVVMEHPQPYIHVPRA